MKKTENLKDWNRNHLLETEEPDVEEPEVEEEDMMPEIAMGSAEGADGSDMELGLLQQDPISGVQDMVPVKQALLHMERRKECLPLYRYCQEVKDIADSVEKEMFLELWTDRVLLLSVNLGAGVNSFSAMYFDFLLEEGLLPGEGGGAEIKLNERGGQGLSLSEAKRFIAESGGVMFSIDLTEWCDEIESPDFRDFLLFLYSQAENLRYVFRIPYMEKKEVDRIAAIISDIFTVDTISLPPMRQQDIRETGAALLSEYGYTATEEAMEIFEKRLSEERSDGRFYGMNTVEKVIREMVVEKLRNKDPQEEESLIYAADMKNILSEEIRVQKSPEEKLKDLVAMDGVRRELENILNDMEENKGFHPYYHIRFIGRPGSGRTETARIFGEILKERGMLSGNGFLEYRGEELVGRVSGETTAKTMAICRDAEGCVLFIDGLSLQKVNENDFEDDPVPDYRKEAIECLLARIEESPSSFLLIFAGSKLEMEVLEKKYPKIAALLPYRIEFPDYSKEDLAEIYRRMAKQEGFTLAVETEIALKEYLENLPEKWIESEEFAGARFVRNLFERSKSKAMLRGELFETDAKTIFKSDFLQAAAQNQEKLNQKSIKKYPMGFRLRDL